MHPTNKLTTLKARLPMITLLLFILQPCMDVISYFIGKSGISNIPTLLMRVTVLWAVLLLAFILSKKKRIYIITAVILTVYTLCHIYACTLHGYNDPIGDIANLARIYHMPIMALCLITFVKANEGVYKAIRVGFAVCLVIIAVIEVISVITGTNPYTYANKSIGIIGWFNDGSAQSAVLSALVPMFAAMTVGRFKSNLPMLILNALFSSLILFMFATRLAYIALLMTFLGLVITLLITDRKSIKAIVSLSLIFVLFVCAYPISPMIKNQNMVSVNAVKKQAHIDSLVTGDKAEDLREAYEYYMGGLVGRFGLERVAEEYNYSTEAGDICDVRRMKKTYCSLLMEEQGVTAMLFGMELGDMTHEEWIHDVENDFHGVFYLTGGVGLIMLSLFLLYFVLITFKALIRDFKGVFNIESAGLGMAFIAIMLHAYATCGVLRRPGSSIYLSAILASVYFFVNHRKGLHYDRNKK
ncbi:MAG: O-antigen ligase family protein [Clostridia bacterium]|nr:O-antigen ligase family protein [Clostridia bacterium]